ncbi:hypothetical protein BgiMline_008891 [Biomphalaria glabrata]|nr:hypothetical protein; partial [Biomphalaria glabrata]
MVVKFADSAERNAIVGIDQSEILCIQQICNIILRVENRDTGVAMLHYFCHGLIVESSVYAEHEDVGYFGHHVFHVFVRQLHGAGHDVSLVVLENSAVRRHFDELLQFILAVNLAYFLAQNFIQDQGNWVGSWKGERHEKDRQPVCVGAHRQAVA